MEFLEWNNDNHKEIREYKFSFLSSLLTDALFFFCLFRYTISVQWEHVLPGFPYISETGTLSPESCIFTQLLNIAALLRKLIIKDKLIYSVNFFNYNIKLLIVKKINKMISSRLRCLHQTSAGRTVENWTKWTLGKTSISLANHILRSSVLFRSRHPG